MAEFNVSSPGAAFLRQQANEVKVEKALMWAMRLFLGDVETLALREGTYMAAAAVAGAWAERMSAEALTSRLGAVTAAYVATQQASSAAPDDAYDTAMAVLTAGNENAWSAQLTGDVLHEALRMDSPPAALTAAAPRRDSARGKAMQAAFEKALGPKSGSMSWGDVARRDARTAVTGLDGLLAGAEMRNQGIPYKQWVTRRDERVRDAHAAADGQRVPLDDPFMIGGYPAQRPGDPDLPDALRINCRCVMVGADSPAQGSTALPFVAP